MKQNVKVPDSHESLFELQTVEKNFREKLSDGLYTENTLAVKVPEKALQPSLSKEMHRTAL